MVLSIKKNWRRQKTGGDRKNVYPRQRNSKHATEYWYLRFEQYISRQHVHGHGYPQHRVVLSVMPGVVTFQQTAPRTESRSGQFGQIDVGKTEFLKAATAFQLLAQHFPIKIRFYRKSRLNISKTKKKKKRVYEPRVYTLRTDIRMLQGSKIPVDALALILHTNSNLAFHRTM